MELARRRSLGLLGAERTGHAQVGDEVLAAIQLEQEIFGPTLDVDDALAGEPLGEGRGKGEANVRPAQLDLVDPGAEHYGHEASPHSLDFGQFRHRRASAHRKKTGPAAAPAKILTIVATR